MNIIEDIKHKNMYRVQWPNGDVSVDSENPEAPGGHFGFYNKTRALELSKRNNIEDYIPGQTYNAPRARLEARTAI